MMWLLFFLKHGKSTFEACSFLYACFLLQILSFCIDTEKTPQGCTGCLSLAQTQRLLTHLLLFWAGR